MTFLVRVIDFQIPTKRWKSRAVLTLHTFLVNKSGSKEMFAFLERQESLIRKATSHREFDLLLLEAKSRLLGETINWYARRSFLGIA